MIKEVMTEMAAVAILIQNNVPLTSLKLMLFETVVYVKLE